MALTNPFKVWIRAAATYSILVQQSKCIKLVKYLVLHQRSKHIELHMHFIRNLVHDSVIEVLYFPTDEKLETS